MVKPLRNPTNVAGVFTTAWFSQSLLGNGQYSILSYPK